MKEKIMLKFLKSLFGIESPKPVATPERIESAPYKVPEPAATTPIPYVPEPPLVKLGPEPTVAPVVETTPKPKAPAKTKAAKPAAAKAPAKPKAEKAPAKPKAPATKKPKISIAK